MRQQTANEIREILDDGGTRTVQEQLEEILSLVLANEYGFQLLIEHHKLHHLETNKQIALRMIEKYMDEYSSDDPVCHCYEWLSRKESER